jgi:hypothetical protein
VSFLGSWVRSAARLVKREPLAGRASARNRGPKPRPNTTRFRNWDPFTVSEAILVSDSIHIGPADGGQPDGSIKYITRHFILTEC